MNSKQSCRAQRNRHIFVFLVLTAFAVGTLFFAAGTSAQRRNASTITTNVNSANVNALPPEPKSVVRGRVVYEDTGRPVRRSTVMLLPSAGRGGGGEKSSLTNDAGEFTVKNVEAGSYFPMVIAPGVLNFLAFMDISEMSGPGGQDKAIEQTRLNFEEITVPAGGGEVDIYVRARRGGAIGGRVMYANGDPAIGVKVEIMRKNEEKYTGVISNFGTFASMMFGGGGADGKTDDRGVYRVSGLPPGEYVVRATEAADHSDDKNTPRGGMFGFMEAGGLGSLIRTFHPDVNDVKDAVVLRVEAGQDLSEINITIPERALFNITGKVVAKATQKPIEGASVTVIRKDDTVSFFDQMIQERGNSAADEKGEWKLKEFPAGTYTILVKPLSNNRGVEYDEEGNPRPSQTPKPKFAPFEKEIVITDKDLTDLLIEMPFGGSINGRVSVEGNKPLMNVRVSAVNEKGENLSTSQAEGYDYKNKTYRQTIDFNLENLPAGKFFIEAATNLYGRSSSAETKEIFYVKSIKLGNKEMVAAPFEVSEGAAVNNVQIILATDGGRIKGIVKEKDNSPAANSRILLVPVEQSKWLAHSQRLTAVTDDKGEFTVEGAPVEYFVIFLTGKDKLSAVNENWIRERSGSAEKVVIKTGGETSVNLTAP